MIPFGKFSVDYDCEREPDGFPGQMVCRLQYNDSPIIRFNEAELPHLEAAVAELRRQFWAERGK